MSGKPFYILSLCGGGVRGLLTISFLIEMETSIRVKHPDFSISQFFDMFAGCSIGSIMAGGFAVNKYDTTTLKKFFSTAYTQSIMQKSIKDKILDIFQLEPKYDDINKNAVITDIFGNMKYTETGDKLLVVPTFDIKNKKAKIFRTSKAGPLLLLKDVVCASTAAPCYFPSYFVENCEEHDDLKRPDRTQPKQDLWLIDGGVCLNNPSTIAISEAHRQLLLHGNPEREIRCICIGTGIANQKVNPEETKDYGGIEWLLNGLTDILMNTNHVDQESKWLLQENNYLKIDIELGNADSKIDNTDSTQLTRLEVLGKQMWVLYELDILKLLNL